MGKKVKDEKEIFARYLSGPEQERGQRQQVRQALLLWEGRAGYRCVRVGDQAGPAGDGSELLRSTGTHLYLNLDTEFSV